MQECHIYHQRGQKNHWRSNFFPNRNILANALKKGGPPSFGHPVYACQSSSFYDTVHIGTFIIWNKIFLTLFYNEFYSLFIVILLNFYTCNRSFPHYYRLNLTPKDQKFPSFKMADGSSKWKLWRGFNVNFSWRDFLTWFFDWLSTCFWSTEREKKGKGS